MSRVGGHPIQTFYLGMPNAVTIAASMAGTAAATLISSSISGTYANYMEVFNMTSRNCELVIGNDNGTAAYALGTPGAAAVLVGANSQFFVPGTAAAAVAAGRGNYFPITITQGMQMWLRTTENTPITASSTQPLVIVLWT